MNVLWRVVVPLLVIAAVLVRMNGADQWDFEVYYLGALAERHGVTPYNADNLSALTNGAKHFLFPYMYPPPTIWLFVPFTMLSFQHAWIVWLALKLVCLVALLWLWESRFIPKERWLAWALLLAAGFNSTLYREVRSGNFELFTELLLWVGLAAWLDRRWGAFTAFVVAAAFFKLTPLALLGLLLLEPGGRRYAAAGVGAFAGLLVLSWLSAPGDFHTWMVNVAHHDDEVGMTNPCLLSLYRELAGALSAGKSAADVMYLLTAGGVLAASLPVIARARARKGMEDRKLLLSFVLLTYAIVLPRFMVYAYVLLLVPAWIVALRQRWLLFVLLALFIAHDVLDKVLSTPIDPESAFWQSQPEIVLRLIWLGYLVINYFPFLLAAGVWRSGHRALRSA